MFPQVQERNLLKIQLHSDNKNNLKCDRCDKFQDKFILKPTEWIIICIECNRQQQQAINSSNNNSNLIQSSNTNIVG